MGAPAEPVRHHGQMMSNLEADIVAEEHDAVWEVPVLATVAVSSQGIEQLVDNIFEHKLFLTSSGEWYNRELARSRQEIGQLLQTEFLNHMRAAVAQGDQEALIKAVAERKIDPYAAVNRLFTQAGEQGWKPPQIGKV